MKPTLTKLFLVLTLLVSAMQSSAQKVWFCDSANSWVTHGNIGGDCDWDRTVRLGADTLIIGQTYRKVNYSAITYNIFIPGCNADIGLGFFVREDPSAGIVYYRQPSFDQYEHILYNYNLNVGDTIHYEYSMYPGGSVADSVVNVDTILIGGVDHKVFDFASVTGRGYRAYTVIEGVGCINNPVYPAFAGECSGYSENLRCFSQSGLVQDFLMRQNTCGVLGNTFYINCDYLPTTTSIAESTTFTTTIFPNPTGSDIQVTIAPQYASSATVSVYDVMGRCVYHKKAGSARQSETIGTSYWANGSYLVVVADNNTGILKKEMVVITH